LKWLNIVVDREISLKIVKEHQKQGAKAAKPAGEISKMTLSARLLRVKKEGVTVGEVVVNPPIMRNAF
jgi:hypothetical protein